MNCFSFCSRNWLSSITYVSHYFYFTTTTYNNNNNNNNNHIYIVPCVELQRCQAESQLSGEEWWLKRKYYAWVEAGFPSRIAECVWQATACGIGWLFRYAGFVAILVVSKVKYYVWSVALDWVPFSYKIVRHFWTLTIPKTRFEESFIVMVYCVYSQRVTLSTFSLISLFQNCNILFKGTI